MEIEIHITELFIIAQKIGKKEPKHLILMFKETVIHLHKEILFSHKMSIKSS